MRDDTYTRVCVWLRKVRVLVTFVGRGVRGTFLLVGTGADRGRGKRRLLLYCNARLCTQLPCLL